MGRHRCWQRGKSKRRGRGRRTRWAQVHTHGSLANIVCEYGCRQKGAHVMLHGRSQEAAIISMGTMVVMRPVPPWRDHGTRSNTTNSPQTPQILWAQHSVRTTDTVHVKAGCNNPAACILVPLGPMGQTPTVPKLSSTQPSRTCLNSELSSGAPPVMSKQVMGVLDSCEPRSSSRQRPAVRLQGEERAHASRCKRLVFSRGAPWGGAGRCEWGSSDALHVCPPPPPTLSYPSTCNMHMFNETLTSHHASPAHLSIISVLLGLDSTWQWVHAWLQYSPMLSCKVVAGERRSGFTPFWAASW